MAIILVLCLWVFLQVLGAGRPVNGSAGVNPSLIFRPKPQEGNGSVIWFRADDPASYQNIINDLTKFLDPYKQDSQNLVDCGFKSPPRDGLVCDVEPREWGPCSETYDFGYNSGSRPCVFLQLNNINGWSPEYYDDLDALPSEMPVDLRQRIEFYSHDKDFLKVVWVSCDGESPADRENIGPLRYLPRRGFPGYFFPYTGQESYRIPLVALRLENPTRGLPIRVKCRAWAHNIKYDETQGLGFAIFEIMVE